MASEQPAQDQKPAGGYNPTPVTPQPPGYTVKIIFHRATRLPLADFATLSSDPYVKAELRTALPGRSKEDPPITFRTRTIWHSTEPEWEQEWVLQHVPASGFRLKARLYDEDSNDRDDRLGNAHILVGPIDENWKGIHNQAYDIKKRSGSWRAYALRAVASAVNKEKRLGGDLFVSVLVLGRSEGDNGGRVFTSGLNYWCKNYSPLLGRITGSKEPDRQGGEAEEGTNGTLKPTSTTATGGPGANGNSARGISSSQSARSKTQRYNFQSNQLQLRGPVPEELYHRYVEFRPFVKAMYTRTGIQGIILSKALHHQHSNIYNFNRQTEYGVFKEPCIDMTRKFLDLAHWAQGGRIHTYVITLDGLLRFTETGKEFGIDLLSKHTMHSDVSIYIAYSGEFFIRRTGGNHHASEPAPSAGAQAEESSDPADYELIVDNDSGTYRPNAALLPLLRDFLQQNFPGLKVVTLDCQADEALMGKLKDEQREKKKAAQGRMVFTELSRSSSMSSDDDR